jgi:hypothetical protein
MALRMASPYRHPKTGMFWFRRRVPDALRPLLRKTIYQRSLGTKDVIEAKRKFLQVAASVDREWSRLLVEGLPPPDEPPRLTRKQTLGLAGEFYRWLVAGHDEEPGSAEKGLVTLLNQVSKKPALAKVSSCRDCLAPRAHRHGAKRAMRLS